MLSVLAAKEQLKYFSRSLFKAEKCPPGGAVGEHRPPVPIDGNGRPENETKNRLFHWRHPVHGEP